MKASRLLFRAGFSSGGLHRLIDVQLPPRDLPIEGQLSRTPAPWSTEAPPQSDIGGVQLSGLCWGLLQLWVEVLSLTPFLIHIVVFIVITIVIHIVLHVAVLLVYLVVYLVVVLDPLLSQPLYLDSRVEPTVRISSRTPPPALRCQGGSAGRSSGLGGTCRFWARACNEMWRPVTSPHAHCTQTTGPG